MSEQIMTVRSLKRREAMAAYAFILPTLLGFLVFVVGPMLASFALSLFDWNLLTPPEYVGLANWEKLFSDARVGGIYVNTLRLSLMVVFSNMTFGLLFAILLDSKLPVLIRNFFRIS